MPMSPPKNESQEIAQQRKIGIFAVLVLFALYIALFTEIKKYDPVLYVIILINTVVGIRALKSETLSKQHGEKEYFFEGKKVDLLKRYDLCGGYFIQELKYDNRRFWRFFKSARS